MLRFVFALCLIMGSFGAWFFKAYPAAVVTIAQSEWQTIGTWFFGSSPEAPVAPEAPAERLPFVVENRSASTIFQPRLRAFAPQLSVPTAHASVILDAGTGHELFASHADEPRQIASLTKLFTAIIAVEQVKDLDSLVTIDREAIFTEGTRIGCPRSGFCNGNRLKPGEQLSVRALLHAMLMNSANDAAMAIAKHIDGTADAFVTRMNERAKELGLTNSHFCTPSGLEIDGQEKLCYSTARDVAKIAAVALDYPLLWNIMQSEKMTIVSADGTAQHEIFNTDQLLGSMPNLLGTKTGFTPLAGYSLLAVANNPQGEHPVIAVVLSDPYRWDSIRAMFAWSFQAYDWI